MAGVAGIGAKPKMQPTNEFERQIFSLLLETDLTKKKKKDYGDYFIDKSNEGFIEDIPYDVITKFIYHNRIYNTDVLDAIFAQLQVYIDGKKESDNEQRIFAKKALNKIIRHIRLALVQYEFISERQQEVYELNYQVQRARDSLYEVSSELEKKVLETEKNIHTNQMSVLGIFAGIVTAFIGGFGVTINIFSNLVNKVPMPKIIAISSLLFIGISCVIYLLLVMSSRMIQEEEKDEAAKKTFYRIVRILALMCLGSALIYQLQFSNENPLFTQQGLWYTQISKRVEIGITIVMIGLAIFPLPIFKIKNWANRKWGN